MATNYEFYKDEILEITRTGLRIAMVEGKLRSCAGLGCDDCDFGCGCMEKTFEWLYAEHIEPPKLTKRERAFCEAVLAGLIARDENGNLHLFDLVSEPYKQNRGWLKRSVSCNHIRLKSDTFKFVKWEDEKPWSIEDLLKLEVEA